MSPINKKLLLVFGAILVLAVIIDWVPGLQFGGADETTAPTTPIETPPTLTSTVPVSAPPTLTSTVPVSPPPTFTSMVPLSPPPAQPQPQPQPVQAPVQAVYSFTIDNINFKVAPFGGANKMSHLIYLPNGTVRNVYHNSSYTFTDTTKDGKRTSYSVFSLKLAKSVSPLRLNDNLTYYMMFTKDFNLAQNLKNLKNAELNKLVDFIGPYAAERMARKPVKIVRTPNNSTVVLYDDNFGAGIKNLYIVKKGDSWSSYKRTLIDVSGYDDNGNSTEKKLEQQRQLIKQKTSYNCGTEAGALEFLNDLAYVPDLHGCPYESLN